MLQEMGGIQNNNSKAHFSKKKSDKSARIQKTKGHSNAFQRWNQTHKMQWLRCKPAARACPPTSNRMENGKMSSATPLLQQNQCACQVSCPICQHQCMVYENTLPCKVDGMSWIPKNLRVWLPSDNTGSRRSATAKQTILWRVGNLSARLCGVATVVAFLGF